MVLKQPHEILSCTSALYPEDTREKLCFCYQVVGNWYLDNVTLGGVTRRVPLLACVAPRGTHIIAQLAVLS